MREIKFRAYFPGNNLTGNVVELLGSNDGYKFHEVTAECFENGRQQFYSSDNFILLQYTGLKDKNGVEIYEGDVLFVDDNYDRFGWAAGMRGSVVYDKGKFWLSGQGSKFFFEDNEMNYVEVIGNIYQDPELLK